MQYGYPGNAIHAEGIPQRPVCSTENGMVPVQDWEHECVRLLSILYDFSFEYLSPPRVLYVCSVL